LFVDGAPDYGSDVDVDEDHEHVEGNQPEVQGFVPGWPVERVVRVAAGDWVEDDLAMFAVEDWYAVSCAFSKELLWTDLRRSRRIVPCGKSTSSAIVSTTFYVKQSRRRQHVSSQQNC
jgi:hypothetical protein